MVSTQLNGALCRSSWHMLCHGLDLALQPGPKQDRAGGKAPWLLWLRQQACTARIILNKGKLLQTNLECMNALRRIWGTVKSHFYYCIWKIQSFYPHLFNVNYICGHLTVFLFILQILKGRHRQGDLALTLQPCFSWLRQETKTKSSKQKCSTALSFPSIYSSVCSQFSFQ